MTTDEELETAPEQPPSDGAELTALHRELRNRNIGLGQFASDLSRLLVGVDIPIVVIGDDRRVRRFTPMAEKTLNLISSDVGRPISDIRHKVELPDLGLLISEVINHGRSVERGVRDHDGRWYSLRLGPYRTAENKIDGVLMALVDIDSIKRGLEEITRSRDDVAAERDFSAALLDLVSAPVVVRNPDGRIVIFNRAAQQACGYSPQELRERKAWDSLVAPEHRRVAQAAFRKVCLGADEPVRQEAYWVAKDGTRRLISWTNAALRGPDGSTRQIISTGVDLTESRIAADALRASEAALRLSQSQLRALAASLLTAQEEERRRISRDLHDDINQKLAMLAVETESLERDHPRLDQAVRERLQALRARVIQLSDDVRRTAHQLHPASLEHLGLSAALKSLCADFTEQESIRIRHRYRNVPKSVPPDVALCLYRITQEALHNVARHSRARSVQLTLSATGGGLRLRIDDDGVGFKRGSAKRKVGLGITSMEERARLVGGTVSVFSRPGRGTRIDVRIPAPAKEQ